MGAIIYCRAVVKDAKSLEEIVLQQTCIHFKLVSKDENEQSNAMIYWNILQALWGTIHMHFVAPNPIGIQTKVTTNDDKSTVHLMPAFKFSFEIHFVINTPRLLPRCRRKCFFKNCEAFFTFLV